MSSEQTLTIFSYLTVQRPENFAEVFRDATTLSPRGRVLTARGGPTLPEFVTIMIAKSGLLIVIVIDGRM